MFLSPLRAADPLVLTERQEAGAVVVEARNTDPYATRWVWLQLQSAQNVRTDTFLPQGFVLAPRQQRILFMIRAQDPSQGYRYNLLQHSGEGDPKGRHNDNAVYLLPFVHGSKRNLTQGYFGSATHQGLHALDFDLPEGTPIHAARAGVVCAIKQDSDRGGESRLYANEGNYVQIMHEDATWAIYAHVQRGGARVALGDHVLAGQVIALSGSTGLASGPHLHFAVYQADWNGPRTVPTEFQVGLNARANLEEGRSYYAWHPGGEPFKAILGENLSDEDFRGQTRTAKEGAIRLREEKIDRKVFIWAANPTAKPIYLEARVDDLSGATASVELPFSFVIPARTEVYGFHLNLVGNHATYRLAARWRGARPGDKP